MAFIKNYSRTFRVLKNIFFKQKFLNIFWQGKVFIKKSELQKIKDKALQHITIYF